MAGDISKRVERLRARRSGMDRLGRLNEDARIEIARKAAVQDSWQNRASSNQQFTRYALGSMQEVGPEYTQISVETAERVGKQLREGLPVVGITVEFRLQGSVPLNVHIRGVSDVDLLTLDLSFRTYATAGNVSRAGGYTSPTSQTSIGILQGLRREAEKILKDKYPAATVDTSGGKAISLSGGSLARPVDVVPSHWYDNVEYQASRQEYDRAVTILNKKVPETIDNLPFLHIKRVHDRDTLVGGSLKKAIRLCKNVKSDAEEEGTSISFPSFDIAATMYHADLGKLRLGAIYELAILAETQRYLDWLTRNELEAQKLTVPDGSRRIFDSPEKLAGLRRLSIEMDDLAREVAKEQGVQSQIDQPTLDAVRSKLESIYVP